VARNTFKTCTILAAAASIAGSLAYTTPALAFNFGDMMNPGKWMGGRGRDRYDDDYYDGPYGPYGGPGWGGPGYGWGGPGYGGGYPGYGGYGYPGAGYGYPGAGYGYPGVGYPAAVPAAPAAAAVAPAPAPVQSQAPSSSRSSSSSASEIEALKRRIDELESAQGGKGTASSAPAGSDWPSAPSFRPMNKY